MFLRTLGHVTVSAALAAIPLTVGCSANAGPDASSAAEAPPTNEDAFTSASSTRKAILDGVRAQVNADFAGAKSLAGYKLVFVVRKLNDDGKKAALMARVMKRDAQGRDFELTAADYKGSYYEPFIAEGAFDGPEVVALVEKKGASWTIMEKNDGEEKLRAFVMGPTDVAWEGWDTMFGVPRAWLFGT